MSDLGTPPDRSWLTRGVFSPSPWGRIIAPIVAETKVEFYRTDRPKNTMGGFVGGVPGVPYLTAMCHIEIEDRLSSPGNLALVGGSVSPTQSRHYVIMLPVEAVTSPDQIPVSRDRVHFIDAVGRVIDTPIMLTPDNPVNAQDHFEIQTEEFE